MVRIRAAYKKSEVSRQQVLDAAVAVLSAKGMAGASVQDIANAAGLSKGAVHYHFDSKEELLARVLDHCCEVIEGRILGAFAEPGLPLERVQRALHEMWRVRRDGMPEFRVLSELHGLARQNAEIRRAYGAALQRARAHILDTGLSHLVAMGLKPRVPVQVIPRLLMATLDGLSLHHELDPIPADEEAAVMQALEVTALGLFEF